MMPDSEGQLPQSYSPEEIQQILHLAIARQPYPGELSREQLWEIAAELEIDQQSLQAAELDWLNQKALDKKRQEFDRYRQHRFRQKTVKYVIVNIFLVSLNIISAGAITWSLYIL
ncbi:MAG: 2TM domain-containing protein, partial [Microcystaceae cyanobacterium]